MNIALTQTAEALIEQLLSLGHENPELVVEQALQYFYNQQQIDTSIGFPDLAEVKIIEENEQRWQAFQQDPKGIPQTQVEALFANKSKQS
jgi:hypothetical protein